MNEATKKSLKYLDFSLKATSIFVGVALITGFLILNFFLSGLGFSEYQIIHARFILTGAWFLFYALILAIVVYYSLSKISIISRIFRWISGFATAYPLLLLLFSIFIALALIWLYAYLLFPYIPGRFGGGRPRAISFLVKDSSRMNDMELLGIKRADGARLQTANLCATYENADSIVFLLPDRVLKLNKDMMIGFGSLPELSSDYESFCWRLAYARLWGRNPFVVWLAGLRLESK